VPAASSHCATAAAGSHRISQLPRDVLPSAFCCAGQIRAHERQAQRLKLSIVSAAANDTAPAEPSRRTQLTESRGARLRRLQPELLSDCTCSRHSAYRMHRPLAAAHRAEPVAAVDAYRRITLDGRTFLEPLPLLRPLVLALPLSNERTRACPCKSSMEDHLGSSLSGFGPRRRDDDGRVEKLAAAQRGALHADLRQGTLGEPSRSSIPHSITTRTRA
jgi:hypothetical protein